MANSDDSPAAVYVAWGTFENALKQLSQGVPNRIDRSVFPGLSGGVQTQLLAGFKFLGMIDDAGKPLEAMHSVAVADDDARKRELRAIIESRYSDIFALDLLKTTPAELSERMGEAYGVSGTTRTKAVRFLITCLDYVGVKVSPLLAKPRPGPKAGAGSPRKKAARKSAAKRNRNNDRINAQPEQPSGPSQTIELSGGTVTLSASLDLFALDAADRDFVFGLIDQMRSYESAQGADEDPNTDEEEGS
jgi:hypothetical protein